MLKVSIFAEKNVLGYHGMVLVILVFVGTLASSIMNLFVK